MKLGHHLIHKKRKKSGLDTPHYLCLRNSVSALHVNGVSWLDPNKKNKKHETLETSAVFYMRSSDDIDEIKVLNRLTEAINLLPDKQKLVFNLRYYDEMSYQDMADVTETSIGALKASYHHAVKKIEEHLKSEI